jgi:hypothetical protein
VKNQIASALVERILRAAKSKKKFKVSRSTLVQNVPKTIFIGHCGSSGGSG